MGTAPTILRPGTETDTPLMIREAHREYHLPGGADQMVVAIDEPWWTPRILVRCQGNVGCDAVPSQEAA